ncbi:MAG: alpha/beta hydrolase-fold protein [Eudoraea sp.]|uniref:alpha/beta hydrolase-fold protein n=1 Tax=Eudoraea sp. TaxID=1979955 RepID=UPI003C76F66D
MKNYLLYIAIAFTLVNCQQKEDVANLEKPTNQIVIGQIDSVYSNILDESRNIWVHIPESAKNSTSNNIKYPVLYLLDGPGHFYSVTGMIKQLSTTNGNTIVPEMIIVAIPNTDRSRDLTPSHVDFDFFSGDSIQYSSGGGNKFLDFMEDELIPHIEKTYPVSSYRTFVGHSFGGLSVINALISRQHLFNNYVAIDPSLWWDNQAFLKVADSILSVNKFDGKALYVGVANTMDEGMIIKEVRNDTTKSTAHIRSILQFVNSIDTQNDNGLLFGWKYYNDDDHGSVPLITEYDAFRFLFAWYTVVGINRFFDPNSNTSAEGLIDLLSSHYKNVSDRFGYQVLPPEQFINSMGYGFMNNSMLDKASALFDLNIQNYPKSSNVYDSRGDCFLAQQDSIKALEYFTKALEVGSNDFSQEKIDMLKEKLLEE